MRENIIGGLLTIQFVLSQVAIFKESTSITDHVGIYLVSSFGSLILGLLLLFSEPKGIWAYIINGAFYLTTVASIALLVVLVVIAFTQGSILQLALAFVYFLWVYVILGPIGGLTGGLYYWVRKATS